MKEFSKYIEEVVKNLGTRVALPDIKEECLVYRHVPMMFSKALESLLAPMSVYVSEENDGRCTIVANASSWQVIQNVL